MAVQWYEPTTEWLGFTTNIDKKRFKSYTDFYQKILDIAHGVERNGVFAECQWYQEHKPYYRLYPGVIKPFLKVNIDKVDCGYLKMPTNTLAIQIPSGCVVDGDYELRSILIVMADIEEGKGIYADIEYGRIGATVPMQMKPGNIMSVALMKPMKAGMMFGEMVGDTYDKMLNTTLPTKSNTVLIPKVLFNAALKIIAVCLLLENDPQIISPDVLSADQEKFKLTLDPKYIEKAKRRGKFGWVIGRDIEVSPHIRAPSPFALYWTGKGRTIPIIRYRAGCVVHRELVDKIPTGFDPEQENNDTHQFS
jgi:hypothetical protein